jgi:hypothetical protein
MQVPASLAGFPKLIYKYKQSLQVQSKQHHILCCGRCHCMASVGAVLRSRLLRGHGVCHRTAFCVAGTVVAWPWWASCCGRVCCMAAVCVVMPHFVLRALSLHGRGGRHVEVTFVASPRCVSSRRVMSRSGLLRGRRGHCVAVAFVAWPRCVSSRRVVSRSWLLHDRGGCLLAMLCCSHDGWGHGGLLRERVCPSARRPIECNNWAAKEEVSKKQTKRKCTNRAGG